jgi:hypothetical protein
MTTPIKRYGLMRGSHGGRMSDDRDTLSIDTKPYVLHADHLASHAYDEAKERAAAFVACPTGYDWGTFWLGWKYSAKSRAKAAGCI